MADEVESGNAGTNLRPGIVLTAVEVCGTPPPSPRTRPRRPAGKGVVPTGKGRPDLRGRPVLDRQGVVRIAVDGPSSTGMSSIGTSVGRCCGGAVHDDGSQARQGGRRRRRHPSRASQGKELFGSGACGGRLRGLGLCLTQTCDRVGEADELLRELQQLPRLRRQRDADGGQAGGGGAQPPTGRRPELWLVVRVAAGVLEGTHRPAAQRTV